MKSGGLSLKTRQILGCRSEDFALGKQRRGLKGQTFELILKPNRQNNTRGMRSDMVSWRWKIFSFKMKCQKNRAVNQLAENSTLYTNLGFR